MKTTRNNYRKDKYFPKVQAAVIEILKEGDFVAPVDVFQKMGYLTREKIEDWRFGRVPYLERVIGCNLSKTQRILRILKHHAEACRLKPSKTFYKRWGKRGPKQPLRFSKTGNPYLEELYSTHYVASRRIERRRRAAGAEAD